MFDMDQPKVAVSCKITYTLPWRQGVQFSTDSSESKTEFAVITLCVRKNFDTEIC